MSPSQEGPSTWQVLCNIITNDTHRALTDKVEDKTVLLDSAKQRACVTGLRVCSSSILCCSPGTPGIPLPDTCLSPAVLQLFCSSPKAALRYAAVRTLNKVRAGGGPGQLVGLLPLNGLGEGVDMVPKGPLAGLPWR